jgi:hypothetical protein
VHIQDRFWVMSYGNGHETSNLRTQAFHKGAQGAGGLTTIFQLLRLPSLPDTPGKRPRRDRTRTVENLGCGQQTVRNAIHEFNERGLRSLTPASSRPKEVHAAFDEEGTKVLRELLQRSPREFGTQSSLWTLEDAAQISFAQGLTPKKRVSGETIRATLKRLWVRSGSAPSGGSKAPIQSTKGKGALKRLIGLAQTNAEWALGYEDETWWGRFEQPSLHSWAEARKDDPDPKALSYYGLFLPEVGQS